MTKRISITVEAPEKHPDVLDVRDAMQQVLDFFDLLSDEGDENVVWNLAAASTNSPLTVEGEPIDLRTRAAATAAVAPRVAAIEAGLRRITSGEDWGEAFPIEKRATATRMLRRSADGIGITKVRFGDPTNVVSINQKVAKSYFERVEERSDSLYHYLFARKPRREYGSVEGRIASLGEDYEQPSIILKEANTGREIPCRVDANVLNEVRETMRAGDIWDHRRIRIRGIVNFDKDGNIFRVFDGRISFIEPAQVDLSDVRDENFTEGYSVTEYLDRLREGDFGG